MIIESSTIIDFSVIAKPIGIVTIAIFALYGFFMVCMNLIHIAGRIYKDKLDNTKDILAKEKDCKITTLVLEKENSKEIHDLREEIKQLKQEFKQKK